MLRCSVAMYTLCCPRINTSQHAYLTAVPCILSASSMPSITRTIDTAFPKETTTAAPDSSLLEVEGLFGARPEDAHLALLHTSAEGHSTQAGELDSLLQHHARRPGRQSVLPAAARAWACSPARACPAAPSYPEE